jgi:hypothetical protein
VYIFVDSAHPSLVSPSLSSCPQEDGPELLSLMKPLGGHHNELLEVWRHKEGYENLRNKDFVGLGNSKSTFYKPVGSSPWQ